MRIVRRLYHLYGKDGTWAKSGHKRAPIPGDVYIKEYFGRGKPAICREPFHPTNKRPILMRTRKLVCLPGYYLVWSEVGERSL